MHSAILSFAASTFAVTITVWMWMPTVMSTQQILNDAIASTNCIVPTVPAAVQYKGLKYNTGNETRLRISNGGGTRSIVTFEFPLT